MRCTRCNGMKCERASGRNYDDPTRTPCIRCGGDGREPQGGSGMGRVIGLQNALRGARLIPSGRRTAGRGGRPALGMDLRCARCGRSWYCSPNVPSHACPPREHPK